MKNFCAGLVVLCLVGQVKGQWRGTEEGDRYEAEMTAKGLVPIYGVGGKVDEYATPEEKKRYREEIEKAFVKDPAWVRDLANGVANVVGNGMAARRSPSWSDWAFDKAWGKVEDKAASEGWFSGFWGNVKLVFWLVVAALMAFIALCFIGTVNRVLGRGS